ncbi:MAG: transglutaminase-like domain-containing protein [Parabacteroides gordonii]|uniref:transglutaminase-like domain-containing protein n=1 Tax=Parabacteroides gordonii TaxID=574930 RepID=UPI003A8401E2
MSKYPFMLIMCMFIAQSVFAQSYSKYFRLANQDTVNFTFTVKKPDIKAIDCYPQRITQISKNGDNYEISLTTINPYLDGSKLAKMIEAKYDKSREYDREIARFLQSTPLIDVQNEHIRQIADTLFKDETQTFIIIEKALKFVYTYLSPSDSIAKQIDAGICRTVDVNTVIQTRKGTCSEYTNVFTALMRYMNIPTRFAVGYWNVPEWNSESTHAWPECYIEGAGWCSVDPTMPSYICPHFAEIRMRYGIDYEDCDIKTLNYDIEPIEFTKK